MNSEIIPKIKIVKRQVEGIRLSVASLILMFACTFLIVLSTFVQFDVVHFTVPLNLFGEKTLKIDDFLYTHKFIPQIPVILFVAAFLGRKFGLAAITLYIMAGLFFVPIFALGGGLKYIFEYGFGYILAYIPAVFFVTSILKSGFSVRNIIQATLVGVLTVHLFGIVYMFFIAGLNHEGWTFMQSWIVAQSGIKIIYDFIFSFLAIFAARYLKVLLWFYM